MRTTYDSDADALYITVNDGEVSRTDEIDTGTLVDVDRLGVMVGIEILRPARPWPVAEIARRYSLTDQDVRQLQMLAGGDNAPFSYGKALASC